MSLLSRGGELLPAARHTAPTAEAELYLMESESRLSEWSEGKPENRIFSRATGAGVRLIQDGRPGFAHTNTLTPDSLARAGRQAADACATTAVDLHARLPAPQSLSEDPLDVVDASLTADTFEQRAAFLSSLEAEVRFKDPRLTKVLQATYREGTSSEALISSTGVSAEQSSTHVSFTLACVAVQGTETQVGYGFQSACHYADLNIKALMDKTVGQTLALLNGRQVSSGRYDLIIDPWVMMEFLGLYADALSAEAVQKGKSFLGTKKGEPVASKAVFLRDEPRRKRSVASGVFDGEGMPTENRSLIDAGVLQDFLYDTRTARQAGRGHSGNAGRGSYKSLPEPGTSNFFLSPGTQTADHLIGDVRRGLYIHNVMGMHTVDTIAGDYSLGIMGEWIENGERKHGVRGVTIAGNLLEFLKQVDAVGSDLIFAGSQGSPTVRVRDIAVGGMG